MRRILVLAALLGTLLAGYAALHAPAWAAHPAPQIACSGTLGGCQ